MANSRVTSEMSRAFQSFGDATRGERRIPTEHRRARRQTAASGILGLIILGAVFNSCVGGEEGPAKNGSAAIGEASPGPDATESGAPVAPALDFNCRSQSVDPAVVNSDGSLLFPTKHEVAPEVDGKKVVLSAYRYSEKGGLGDLLSSQEATNSVMPLEGMPLQPFDIKIPKGVGDKFGVAVYASAGEGDSAQQDVCGGFNSSEDGLKLISSSSLPEEPNLS